MGCGISDINSTSGTSSTIDKVAQMVQTSDIIIICFKAGIQPLSVPADVSMCRMPSD